MKITKMLALTSTGLLLLSGCGSAASQVDEGTSSEMTTVKVGLVPVAEAATVYLAQEEGFFEDEGLTVETQVIQNGAAIVPAMLNGQLQFGAMSLPPLLTAVQKGLPLKAVANAADVPLEAASDPSALLVAEGSEISSPKDLEGKTVAVNALSAMLQIMAAESVAQDGGDPSKVTFVAMPFPEMGNALERGDVDAVSIVEPFYSAELRKSAVPIGNPFSESLKSGGTSAVYVAAEKMVKTSPETVEKFSKALDRASEAAAKDPQKIKEVLEKYGDFAPEILDEMRLPAYSSGVDAEAVDQAIDVMVRQGFIPDGSVHSENVLLK